MAAIEASKRSSLSYHHPLTHVPLTAPSYPPIPKYPPSGKYSVTMAAIEASKRSSDIAWAAGVAKQNARDFIQRRLTTPTVR